MSSWITHEAPMTDQDCTGRTADYIQQGDDKSKIGITWVTTLETMLMIIFDCVICKKTQWISPTSDHPTGI